MGAAFRIAGLAAGLAWALAGPALAQGFEGALDATSPESGGYRYLAFAFDVTGDAPVQVTLRSTEFDAYLILVAPGGAVSQNDDFSGSDAGISTDAPAGPMDGDRDDLSRGRDRPVHAERRGAPRGAAGDDGGRRRDGAARDRAPQHDLRRRNRR